MKGKIIRILNHEEVLLNVGTKDGVKEGMNFVIISIGEQVIDPATREKLGAIETIKGKITITLTQERFSRARTLITEHSVPVSAAGFWERTKPKMEKTPEQRSKLKINEQQVIPLNEDLTVKLGDFVRSL